MLKNYFNVAVRNLKKNQAYTVLNVLGLGVGIGCSLLLFLFVYFHYSTDTHHSFADRMYRVVLDIDVGDGSLVHEPGVAVPMVDALEKDYPQVERSGLCMFFYTPPTLSIMQSGTDTKRLADQQGVAYANEQLLYMLNYEFLQGNKATALLKPRQAVVTMSMAQKLFGTEQALGKVVRINNKEDLVVSGVVKDYPQNTDFKTDMLISLPTLKVINPSYQLDNFSWTGANNWVLVQLAEGYEEADMEGQLTDFREKYLGEDFPHWTYQLQPLSEMHFDEKYGGTIRQPLLHLLIAVGLFLLTIACINFINLSTASSAGRHKEVGLRKVMGSSRQQLFWQFMTEAALITFLAFLIGILMTYLLMPKINGWLDVSVTLSDLMNTEVVSTACFMFVCIVLMAGAYPAVLMAGLSPQSVFRASFSSVPSRGGLLRKVLVTAQFMLAQVFAIGALVAIFQMDYFFSADPGFTSNNILTITIPASEASLQSGLRNALMQQAEVTEVSLHYRPPMTEKMEEGYVKFEGEEKWKPFMVRDRWADAHYVETFDLKLIAGRNIQVRDSVMEFLVNEDLVAKLGITDPEAILNKSLMVDNSGVTGTIVGVVEDFHQQSLQYPIEPVVIYPFSRLYRQASVKLKTKDLGQTIPKLQSAWHEIYPDHEFKYSVLDESLVKMYQHEATIEQLIRLFAWVTLIICCLGLYGLTMFTVNQKVKEIGIRKVLGASVSSVLLLLSGSYLRLIGIAFILAVPLANYIFSEWLQNFAYRIEISWWLFAIPGIVVLLIATVSVSTQTLKAARQNPVDSLRYE